MLVDRAVINTRGSLAVSKTDCWPDAGAGKTPYNIRAPYLEASDAIDELKARKGNMKLEESDKCERVACSGTRGAIFVCWQPVDGAPDVYEKPWSTVAEYAQGVTQQWCKPYVHQNSPIPVVGGKVWDPQGMVVYVKSDKC